MSSATAGYAPCGRLYRAPATAECFPSVLHRQVLQLEDLLREKTRELQDAVLAYHSSETRRRHAESSKHQAELNSSQLKAIFDAHTGTIQHEIMKLRDIADEQQSEITTLRQQLRKEQQKTQQTIDPKCPLVGDPDWPEELDEGYVADRVPLGARTFATTLLQHVRVVQATKEGRIAKLHEDVVSLTTDYQREKVKSEANARLVARMHREVEYWKAQVHSGQSPAPTHSPSPAKADRHREYHSPPVADRLDRSADRLQSMYQPRPVVPSSQPPVSDITLQPKSFCGQYSSHHSPSPAARTGGLLDSPGDWSSRVPPPAAPSLSPFPSLAVTSSYEVPSPMTPYAGSSTPYAYDGAGSSSASAACCKAHCQDRQYCSKAGPLDDSAVGGGLRAYKF